MNNLVVRLSSFGDVVLCGAVTSALAPVTFLTSARFVEVAKLLPGVVEVLAWEDRAPLASREFGRVVDLHASWRSRRCTAGLADVWRVRRYDLRRRARVALKVGAPPPKVVVRYAEAAGVGVAARPWIAVEGPRDALVLAPGAQHATKRWSTARWAELARTWDGAVLAVGGPGEEALLAEVARMADRAIDVVVGRSDVGGLTPVLQALGRARVVVAGDTGLMHLAGACGIPVVALFGPTTSADGFWCHEGEAVELDLFCRPCSRFGGAVCPIGDHLCLEALDVERVRLAAVRQARAV